ncbi:hypothetical protein BLA29_001421 [Euroglyphus maynei]|uniref:Chromodomain-helicase-DNA-binding protein 6-9 tri-helical domain-containing protein n=1 Tax=Euroglyphus maynei TaxID=6958 RepID=A0A1Y3BSM8_EURMA|nr:hypothetical protein BLA29_001421 [Euroglyphus maynei]
MRQDPALCFLALCGPPDGAALLAEITSEDDVVKMDDDDEPDTPATPATPAQESKDDKNDKIKEGSNDDAKEISTEEPQQTQQQQQQPELNYLPFPTTSEMNNRLRRLVTCYQRSFKKEEARIAQKARHMQRLERLEKFEAAIRERENKKREQAQKKWSRREESDFYRVVSSFGIEYNKKTDTFDWTRFRMYAKLEKKLDETLTEYFKAFYAMCKKVVGRRLTEDEENLPISVDPITEERANRCLARIELLNKVRDEIINHPELDERLKLFQTQLDLPEWWICGKHDKDLLIGAAKYGLNRLDYNLMNDTELSFIEIVRNFEAQTAAEEKAVNEKAEFEMEIRSILNEMIDKISKESEDQESMIDVDLEGNESKEMKPLTSESDISSTYIRPQLKWPRDRVLQIRLENVCLAVEKNEWPTFRSLAPVMHHSCNNTPSIATADSSPRPSTPCSLSSASQELTPHPTPDHTPRHETQSPFTPSEYFYQSNTAPQIINNYDDSNKKRRRRRRRFEMDNEKTKLHSLLNANLDQSHNQSSSNINNSKMMNPNIATSSSHIPSVQNNPNTFASSLFKNTKTTNSLLNSIPSQFLTPFLNNLPFNIRSTLREELLNDEKAASILFGSSFQSTLAAAVANVSKAQAAKSNVAGTGVIPGLEKTSTSKGGIVQSGPPPAHQSSSRNALSLGSLDLTSKFKSATSAVLEKTNVPSNRSNVSVPHPAHKHSQKNPNEKADVLDLSSVPCKSGPSNRSNSMANLLSQTLKKSNFSDTLTSNPNPPVNTGKKRGRTGSRIDALALNLQAKKMMEEVNPSALSSKFPHQQQQQLAMSTAVTSTAQTPSTSNLSRNLFNEKDLFAAFTSLSSQQQHDKRQSNTLFDELSKSPLFHSVKKNALANLTQQSSSSANVSSNLNTMGTKKPLAASDVSKAYYNMMESFKLLSKQPLPSKQMPSSSSTGNDKNPLLDPKANMMKQNLKALLEENPELLSQSSTFLSIFNNPLFAQSLSQGSNQSVSSSATSQSQLPPPPPIPNVSITQN